MLIEDLDIDPEALNLEFATEYFQVTNLHLIERFEFVEKILEQDELSESDEKDLEDNAFIPVRYFSALFSHLETKYYQHVKEIATSLLQGTLSEAREKCFQFYGSDDPLRWTDKHQYYITCFIRKGFVAEPLINYLNDLKIASEMLDMCFKIANGQILQIPFVSQEDFGFHLIDPPVYNLAELERLVIAETDIQKKLQLFQNEVLRMKMYLNEYPERVFYESEQEYQIRIKGVHEFISKCESHIRIIKEAMGLQITEQPISSLRADEKRQSSYYVVRAASKHKTDIIKILSAMYDARMFAGEDGKPLTT